MRLRLKQLLLEERMDTSYLENSERETAANNQQIEELGIEIV